MTSLFTRRYFPMLVLLALGGCRAGETSEEPEMDDARRTLRVTSSAFAGGQSIPTAHTADGDDVSPPLEWAGAPEGTVEYALICDDPDAPSREPWVHWVIYGIPGGVNALAMQIENEGDLASLGGARQGRNSFTSGETIGYRGPAPPPGHGMHHYRFRVYALDKPIELPSGADKATLLQAMEDRILAWGELVGTYERD